MLDNIRIVLVNTSHPGNIGSAARAMKTMGISNLTLVEPKEFPSARATWMASGAADVLENAVVVPTLDAAVADCTMVIGTSARLRRIPWPLLTPKQCAQVVKEGASKQVVALVFGREAVGLSNEELQKCNYHVSIPGNPDYDVLNIAMAVQVLTYEMRQAIVEVEENSEKPVMTIECCWDEEMANAQEMSGFYEHFNQMLLDIEFYDPNNPKQLLTRSRRLFNRARLDRLELNMLRGVFSRIQAKIKS